MSALLPMSHCLCLWPNPCSTDWAALGKHYRTTFSLASRHGVPTAGGCIVQAMHSEAVVSAEPSVAPHQARLPSHMLVEALNEHVREKRQPNHCSVSWCSTTRFHVHLLCTVSTRLLVQGLA